MTGPTWNVIVGKNFGSHIVHQTKCYLFCTFGKNEDMSVLVWKSWQALTLSIHSIHFNLFYVPIGGWSRQKVVASLPLRRLVHVSEQAVALPRVLVADEKVADVTLSKARGERFLVALDGFVWFWIPYGTLDSLDVPWLGKPEEKRLIAFEINILSYVALGVIATKDEATICFNNSEGWTFLIAKFVEQPRAHPLLWESIKSHCFRNFRESSCRFVGYHIWGHCGWEFENDS